MQLPKLQLLKLSDDDKNIYFKYAVIIIGIMTLFSYKSIKLNVLFGFIIASIFIYVLHKTHTIKIETEEKIKKQKLDKLSNVEKVVLDKDDIVDTLIIMEKYYDINPQAYNEMINNLEIFFKYYNLSIKDKSKTSMCFENMEIYKAQILNSIHSFIFRINSNKVYIDELNKLIDDMDNILVKYLNITYDIHLNYIHDNGWEHSTKNITPNLQPYNSYNINTGEKYDISDKYSYNIY
jgi:hypothetical protein